LFCGIQSFVALDSLTLASLTVFQEFIYKVADFHAEIDMDYGDLEKNVLQLNERFATSPFIDLCVYLEAYFFFS
jgi:hypothetical protein